MAEDVIAGVDRLGSALRDESSVLELRWSILKAARSIEVWLSQLILFKGRVGGKYRADRELGVTVDCAATDGWRRSR